MLHLALEALDKDRDFLKQGGVFTDDVIDSFINLKMEEVTAMRASPQPLEFDLYYSCLLYTSPSPRDGLLSRMPSSA